MANESSSIYRPSAEIWLAPLALGYGSALGADDFADLFDEAAAWQDVAKHVSVFKLYPLFAKRAPDTMLRTILEHLRRHGIKLALEARVLTSTEWHGNSLEGDGGQDTPRLARRIHDLGGRLDFLAMDEPLMHGNARRAVFGAAVAEGTATMALADIRAVRAVFPNIGVGLIEPVGSWVDGDELPPRIAKFAKQIEAATGHKLAFMHADVGWNLPWLEPVRRMRLCAAQLGIPFGVIYTGGDLERSDASWAASLEAHVAELEGGGEGAPQMAVFQSWVGFPRHVLPQSDPHSMTGILGRYLRFQPKLTGGLATGILEGRLLDPSGKGLAGLALRLEVPQGGSGLDERLTQGGSVPHGAHTARFALRMNRDCSCRGSGSVLLKRLAFHQLGGEDLVLQAGDPNIWLDLPPSGGPIAFVEAEDVAALRATVTQEQEVALSSRAFPVISDSWFDAAIRLQASPGSAAAGHVGLLFFDGDGTLITRTVMMLDAGWQELARMPTDAGGDFRFVVPRGQPPPGTRLRVSFEGDAHFRPAHFDLP